MLRDIYTIICKASWATGWSVSRPQRSDAVGHRDHELGNGLRSLPRDHLRLRHQPGELAQDLSRQRAHHEPARRTAVEGGRHLARVRARRRSDFYLASGDRHAAQAVDVQFRWAPWP